MTDSTLQQEALAKAGTVKHGLIVCPPLLRDEWDALIRDSFPGERHHICRAVGHGVDLTAPWVICPFDYVEHVPGLHRTLISQSWDCVIFDRTYVVPELMTTAKLTLRIADRIGAEIEAFKRLSLAA